MNWVRGTTMSDDHVICRARGPLGEAVAEGLRSDGMRTIERAMYLAGHRAEP